MCIQISNTYFCILIFYFKYYFDKNSSNINKLYVFNEKKNHFNCINQFNHIISRYIYIFFNILNLSQDTVF